MRRGGEGRDETDTSEDEAEGGEEARRGEGTGGVEREGEERHSNARSIT